MEDRGVADEHPGWMGVDWRGVPYEARGRKLCFNSPYADFLLARQLALVAMGADAFFYDEVHMPKQGCWCGFCKQGFKEETGLDHPERPDEADPVWHKLIDFNNRSIERVFLKWRRALHAANPEIVMLVGSNTWPTMAERHTTNRLYRIADSQKSEFSLPVRGPQNKLFALRDDWRPIPNDARLALGYTLVRDATGGRPGHIWAHGLLDEASTLYATAGMVTHGNIANLDVSEGTIPNAMFTKAFKLGDRVSPAFAGTEAVRYAAIHFSERARDVHRFDADKVWQRVLYPICGAYETLLRQRVPVGIVTDSQLEDGLIARYRVLILPTTDTLTDAMRRHVQLFKSAGGEVVILDEDWGWHESDASFETASDRLWRTLDSGAAAPLRVTGGPEEMHAVAFESRDDDRERLTVSISNDFSWVYTGRHPEDKDLSKYLQTPPPCRDVTLEVRDAEWVKRLAGASATEVVSGRRLKIEKTANGWKIRVPDFEYLAVVMLE
ncbi:MAG: hypothetical protein ACYTGQ_02740, partial [Planctomycetota bacterium]|jgi:hypothetical protein